MGCNTDLRFQVLVPLPCRGLELCSRRYLLGLAHRKARAARQRERRPFAAASRCNFGEPVQLRRAGATSIVGKDFLPAIALEEPVVGQGHGRFAITGRYSCATDLPDVSKCFRRDSSRHPCQRPPCYFAWGCFRYFGWKRETGLSRARHEPAIGATKSTRLVGLRRSLASLLIGWGLPVAIGAKVACPFHRSLRWLEMGAQRQFKAMRPQLGAMTADCWSGAPRGFMHYSVSAIQIRDHVHASAIRSRRRRSWQLDPPRTRQCTGARPALGRIVLCRRARPYPRPIPDGVGHQYVGQCWQESVSSAEWRRAGIAGPYRDRHLGPSGAARPARIGRQKTRRYRILVQRA